MGSERVVQGSLLEAFSPQVKFQKEPDYEAKDSWANDHGTKSPAGTMSLDELRSQVLNCRRCELRDGCGGVVFGEGDPDAALMLVGEGPGAVEDELGRPFVGPAGKLLDKILNAAGYARQEVYIANIVKCRPPGNRLPTPQEAACCLPNLRAQINIIRPSIIVCLGALATQTLIDKNARITAVRGTWFERNGIKIMPTFHPAALLRDESKKKPVWEDFKKVRSEYEALPPRVARRA